jgi:hypothetical protein
MSDPQAADNQMRVTLNGALCELAAANVEAMTRSPADRWSGVCRETFNAAYDLACALRRLEGN